MSLEQVEKTKNTFEVVCISLVQMLEAEYDAAKSGNYEKLNEINLQKASAQEHFQDFLFQFTMRPQGIPVDLEEHISAVHRLSQRNSAYLAGAIDGVSALIKELRRSADIATFTGLYNPDGSFRASDEMMKTLGKV